MERFPRTRLYGPYHHGGRTYYQWMARGTALVEDVLPLLEGRIHAGIDGHAGRAVRGDVRALRGVHRARARSPGDARLIRCPAAAQRAISSASFEALANRYGLPGEAIAQLRSCIASSSRIRWPRPPCETRARRSTTTWPTRSSRSSSPGPGRADVWPTSAPAPACPACRSRSRCPERSVALVESAARQVRVPRASRSGRRGRRTLDVVHARAEAWPDGLAAFDRRHGARARRRCRCRRVRGAAAGVWRHAGGVARPARSWRRGGCRCGRPRVLGLEPGEIRRMQPYAGAEHRYLHLMSKVMRHPPGFPRRPGMALQAAARRR